MADPYIPMKLLAHDAELATAVHLGRILAKAFIPSTPANALTIEFYLLKTTLIFPPNDGAEVRVPKDSTQLFPAFLTSALAYQGLGKNDPI
jgi:hypothetical protein